MTADEDRPIPDPDGDPERQDDRGHKGNGHEQDGGEGDHSTSPDDWDTLKRFNGFKAGDPAAQELFCQHYESHFRRVIAAHPLLSWLERHGWPREDILGEAFLAFLIDAPRRFVYRGKGSMEGWIRVLTQRSMIDLYRRESSDKRGGGATDVSLGPELDERVVGRPRVSHADDPVSDASHRELLERAAEILTPDEFLAWEMAEVRSFSAAEVVEAMGRTDSAIRALVYRARQKLLQRLEL